MKNDLKKILKPYFWDVNFDHIDLEKHAFFIIEKILEFGGTSEINAILKKYPHELIKKVIIESRNLSPKTVNFWCLKFKINKEQTNCFTTLSQKIWMPY